MFNKKRGFPSLCTVVVSKAKEKLFGTRFKVYQPKVLKPLYDKIQLARIEFSCILSDSHVTQMSALPYFNTV